MVVGDENANVSIDVDGETTAKVKEKRRKGHTREYWMKFKQGANSLLKLSKEKLLSLDMQAVVESIYDQKHITPKN